MFRALQSDCNEQHNATVLHFYSSYRGLKKKAIVNMLSGKIKDVFKPCIHIVLCLLGHLEGVLHFLGHLEGEIVPTLSLASFLSITNQSAASLID